MDLTDILDTRVGFEKYGEAAIVQMLVEALPEVAKNVAAPLANVDTITMYGEGNGAQMVGDIITTMNKVSEGMGLNIPELLQATLTGRAAGNAIGQELTDTKTTPTPTGNLAN